MTAASTAGTPPPLAAAPAPPGPTGRPRAPPAPLPVEAERKGLGTEATHGTTLSPGHSQAARGLEAGWVGASGYVGVGCGWALPWRPGKEGPGR